MNQSQDGSGNRECNGNQGQDNTDPKANPFVTAKVLDEDLRAYTEVEKNAMRKVRQRPRHSS